MEVATLAAEPRQNLGTKHTRRLRQTGRLPGVMYGHGEAPEAFSVSAHDFGLELQHGARLVALQMGGKAQQYLIKEVQYDHLDKEPIHVDLARVDLDERVTVRVGIELRGTPKGVHEGGVLEQLLDEIEIECIASKIPDTLHPSVTDLGVDESLDAKDLELPEGVTLLTDADEKIALVRVLTAAPEAEEEEAVASEEASAAEPELIKREKREEEESGEG